MAARRQPGLRIKAAIAIIDPTKATRHGETIHHMLAGFTRRTVHHVALCGLKGGGPKESVADVAMFIHRISTGVSGIMFPASRAMMISSPAPGWSA